MATRYYFPYGPSAPAAPIDNVAIASAWEPAGAAFGRGYLVTRKRGTPLLSESGSGFIETATNISNKVHRQFVSDPIVGDQLIDGTFTLVLRCGEGSSGGTNANADNSLQCTIRVVSGDGNTVRGTLYGGHTTALNQTAGAVGQEMSTSTTSRLFNAIPVTAVSALNGDRIVVEIGHRYHNTTNVAYFSWLNFGDPNIADLPVAITNTAAPGWFELSANIGHKLSGDSGSGISATDSFASSSRKVGQGTGAITAVSAIPNSSGAVAASSLLNVSFDGTDMATVTTTGTNLSAVNIPATSTVTHRASGAWKNQFVKVVTVATATNPNMTAAISPARSNVFARFYIRYYANPAAAVAVFYMKGTSSATRLNMQILTDGKVALFNGTSIVATSSGALTKNKWIMIQAAYKGSTVELKTFEGSSTTTPSKTLTGASNATDTISSVQFGPSGNIANFVLDFDEAAFDSASYPPPILRVGGTGALEATSNLVAGVGRKIAKGAWGIFSYETTLTSVGGKRAILKKSGSGSISATSVVNSSGRKVAKSSIMLSAISSLTRSGRKVAKGLAAVTGLASVNSTGKKIARGSIAISGTSGTASGTGKKSVVGSGQVSALSVYAVNGKKIAVGGPSLPLVATVTTLGSSGQKSKVFVTGSISSSAVLSALGRKVGKGFGVVANTLVATGTGRKIVGGNGNVFDQFVLSAAGGRNTNYAQGTGLLKGVILASSTGRKVAKGNSGLSSASNISRSTRKVAKGSAFLAGASAGPNSFLGRKVAKGNQTINGYAGVSLIGSKTAQNGQSITHGFANLNMSWGYTKRSGSGVSVLNGHLNSIGDTSRFGSGLVTGFGSLNSSGAAKQISTGDGQLTATGFLATSPGKKYVGGSGVIAHVLVTHSLGIKAARGQGGMVSGGGLAARGSKVATGSARALVGEGDVNAWGKKIARGSVGLIASTNVTSIQGSHNKQGFGQLTATGMIYAFGHKRNPRNPIKIGKKHHARLIHSNIGLAIPLGGFQED